MYKKDLDALIFNKKVPNFILLRGQDDFQNELYAKRLIEYWQSENFMSLYFSEFDFDNAKSFLEPSLFGGTNTLHIKSNLQLKKDEIKALVLLCKKDNSNRLIFELNEEEKTATKDFTSVFEGNDVRFFKPSNTNEAINLLSQKCQMCGIYPNTAALSDIYKKHNENLNLSASEIDKFANLGIELNSQNVADLVFGLSEVSYEELFNEVFSPNPNADFRDKFFALTQNGVYNEVELINNFYRNIFRIFKLHAHTKVYGSFDFVAVFGYKPPLNVQNLMNAMVRNFAKTQTFFEIFKNLNLIEFDLKTKKDIEKTEFLLASLLKLRRILLNTQNGKSKY